MYDNCNTINLERGIIMLSIRLSKASEEKLKEIAEFEGVTVSELVRRIIREKLEDMYDVQLADEAYEEYEEDKVTYSLEEVKRLLNL